MPIDRLNALIVIASSKEQLEYIKTWVVTFDSMFAAARSKIFVYPLQNSKAEHIASLMQSILSGGTTAPARACAETRAAETLGDTINFAAASLTSTPQLHLRRRPGAAVTVSGGGGGFVSAETKIFADEITNSSIILFRPLPIISL